MNRRGIPSGAAVELLAEAFLHNVPAVTGVRIGFEVLQALVEDSHESA